MLPAPMRAVVAAATVSSSSRSTALPLGRNARCTIPYTAAMIAATAARKSRTSVRVRARAASCAWKKSIDLRRTRASERDAGRFSLFRIFDDEQRRFGEVEAAGDQVGRHRLACRVVRHDRIVVSLPREGDLVLGRRQLLAQLTHVRV